MLLGNGLLVVEGKNDRIEEAIEICICMKLDYCLFNIIL
jgi:hypothetical protein